MEVIVVREEWVGREGDDPLRVITAQWRRFAGEGDHALVPTVPDRWFVSFFGVLPSSPLYGLDYRIAQRIVQPYGGFQCNARHLLKIATGADDWYFGMEFLMPGQDGALPQGDFITAETERVARALRAATTDTIRTAMEAFVVHEEAWRTALCQGVKDARVPRRARAFFPVEV